MTTLDHRTILVPLDGSDLAEQAIPLAIALAHSTHRPVRLVHVQVIPTWPAELPNPAPLSTTLGCLRQGSDSYLEQVTLRFAVPDLRLESVVLPHDHLEVGHTIADYAEQVDAGMVVMATHGRGGVRRAWLGSVADYLVRNVTLPVLIVRPGMNLAAAGRHILVPLDGSAFSEAALDEACALAVANRQDLILLRVVQPVMQPMAGLEAPYLGVDHERTAFHRSAAEDYLLQLEERVRTTGVKCSTVVTVDAAPGASIVDLARPAHFAMIVMATHGRAGLRRVISGSVTDQVVRRADVPVMVIRPVGNSPHAFSPMATARMAGPTTCAT